jgi:hypothetical protein
MTENPEARPLHFLLAICLMHPLALPLPHWVHEWRCQYHMDLKNVWSPWRPAD